MYCKNCGSELKASYKFCFVCGTKIEVLESINEQIMEVECKEEKETRFEKFMSKHFYKNLTASDIERCSTVMSILMILIQLVRIICVNFDFSTSFLFGGELFIVLSDWYFLSKMGIRGAWKIWGVFVWPVYLFIKARKTNKKYIWSIICTIIIIGDFFLLLFSGMDNVVACEYVETGALIDMDLYEFSFNFNEKIHESYMELNGTNVSLDLTQYWSNVVPPQLVYEEMTGTPFTLYSAFVDNTYLITVGMVDGKIKGINVGFDYDNSDIPVTFYVMAIQSVADVDFYEALEMAERIRNGIENKTMIYKDEILYCVNRQSMSYSILPATEEFVKRLEYEGCNVIYK